MGDHAGSFIDSLDSEIDQLKAELEITKKALELCCTDYRAYEDKAEMLNPTGSNDGSLDNTIAYFTTKAKEAIDAEG